jgi:hypothetical protein
MGVGTAMQWRVYLVVEQRAGCVSYSSHKDYCAATAALYGML